MSELNPRVRVYVDTSVFGGVFDNEFSKDSLRFFELVKSGYFLPIISPLVINEIRPAKEEINLFFNNILGLAEVIDINNEAITLRKAYIDEGILTEKSSADALHVALATAYRVPLIISWNFKHIVNYKKIPFYNAINISLGYSTVGIYSPKEVIENEE